ncbi:prepilin peptidase [Paenibacillus methanolicus]|uniref:Leader peptidase (Prepilin peptidase)/N-methyltransferase n=1 Tax=Paenibacillus methanolicus TaxID=582686 RepID=A0A5S5BSE7_9BACL|nr:A24 family peptidase [Paenibacillus methanolicus]TYP70111.1 leader peptidase (prepilin peptidase)/N-methyltransferase [Paenibacillus methanolicus]
MTIGIAIYLFILGLVCGSFYNVVGLRVPAKQSVVRPPSHCTSCSTRLRSRDLIPVASYLLAKGKCRHCGAKVSFVYPLGELLTGLLFVAMFLRFGLTLELVAALLLISLAVIITVSDLKYMLIPNKILLAFLPLLVLARIIHHDMPLWQYALGAIFGGGILLLVNLVSGGKMGLGDVKLFAVFGLILGVPNTIVALLLACLLGTVIGLTLQLLHLIQRKQPVPFGPFLALGTIIAFAYGQTIIDGYFSIIA